MDQIAKIKNVTGRLNQATLEAQIWWDKILRLDDELARARNTFLACQEEVNDLEAELRDLVGIEKDVRDSGTAKA